MVARNRARAGQASVELVAALPALALATALALQLLLVGYSMTIADGAAEAGALAGTAGRDAKRGGCRGAPGMGQGTLARQRRWWPGQG